MKSYLREQLELAGVSVPPQLEGAQLDAANKIADDVVDALAACRKTLLVAKTKFYALKNPLGDYGVELTDELAKGMQEAMADLEKAMAWIGDADDK
jgi:hypothetical protein